jgi:hypothetical protein
MRHLRHHDVIAGSEASSSTTEFLLLVELCRRSFAATDQALVRELAASSDWQRFVRLARFHRVQGLVAHALHDLDIAPHAERRELLKDGEVIAALGLRQAQECGELHALAEARGLSLLFLKGLTVGAIAYGNPFLKMGWDVDILVERERLADAADLLRQRGFQLIVPTAESDLMRWHGRRKESAWIRPVDRMYVELHTRLADSPWLIPAIGMSSPAQWVRITRGVILPTLADDELLAYLCVHGASSAWFRLKWITDVAALLQRHRPAEIERLYERTQQLGAARAAAQAFLLADQLYGTLSGTNLAESLRTSWANRLLSEAAFRQLTMPAEPREPTSIPLGTWRIHLTQLFLQPGASFKIQEFGRQALDLLS